MSRAPPLIPFAAAPFISTTSTASIDTSSFNKNVTTISLPTLVNIGKHNDSEKSQQDCENNLKFDDLHSAPQQFERVASSCICAASEKEIDLFVKLKKTALSGDAAAQNQLGQCYFKGINVYQNYAKAVSWFRKSAQSDNKDAQQSLTIAYKEGHGVKKDLTIATYWLLKSSLSGGGCSVTIGFHRDLILFIAPVLAEFPEFSRIKKIEFNRLGLSGEGMHAIAQLIEYNSVIEILDLSGNDVDDAEALLLLQALDNNTNLRQLIFNPKGIDITIVDRIATLLSQKCVTT
jgi:Sel1 repeat